MKSISINLNKAIDPLILLLPVAYLLGSPFVNLILLIGSFFFIFNSIKYNDWRWLKILWVRVFFVFWLYLIITSLFSTDIFNAFRTSFSFIRFLLFSLLISFYGFKNISFIKIINFWKLILLLVLFDILIQFIFDYNIIGLPKNGVRYSGFFGNELIAGSYIFKISAPIIGFLFYKIFVKSKNKIEFIYSVFFCILAFFICLITGERMSFILYSSSFLLTMISILYFQKKIKNLLILLISTLFFVIILFNSSNVIKSRYYELIDILKNIDQSSYGKLFNSGYRLWYKNPIIGVGVKNFRVECDKQLIDIFPENPSQLCSTHPHNLYLELLSETGVIGTIIFIFLFFIYFRGLISKKIFDLSKKKNCILISCLISSLLMIWPLGTSGSFFTTWNGSYLWIQLGMMNYLLTEKNI
jgi:O-antigen ligase